MSIKDYKERLKKLIQRIDNSIANGRVNEKVDKAILKLFTVKSEDKNMENSMIQEDYVSFETAKLLKDKGFSWEWSPFYSEQDKDEWARNNNYNIPNPNYNANIPFDSETLNVIAPHVSLQMAMKWLREVHHIHIEIHLDSMDGKHPIYEALYSECITIRTDNFIDYGDTYEEACEAGIKYCLENLMNK